MSFVADVQTDRRPSFLTGQTGGSFLQRRRVRGLSSSTRAASLVPILILLPTPDVGEGSPEKSAEARGLGQNGARLACRNLRAKSDVMEAAVFQWFIRSPAVQLLKNKEIPAFLTVKHDFGRYGLALEADAAQIASDKRSGGISMLI
jgi:hypothetical protein